MDAPTIALTGVWGGLLALERRAFLQAMFSRPLVAAIGTGLILDDVPSGLFTGLVLELFFLGGASLGGHHPHNELLPAVAAAAASAMAARASGGPGTPALWAIGLLLTLPLAPWGRRAEHWLDARAMRYQGRALALSDSGISILEHLAPYENYTESDYLYVRTDRLAGQKFGKRHLHNFRSGKIVKSFL